MGSPCVDPQGPGTTPAKIRAGHRSGIKIRPQGKEAKSRQTARRNLVLLSLWLLRQPKGPSSSFPPPASGFPILLPLTLPHLPLLLRLLRSVPAHSAALPRFSTLFRPSFPVSRLPRLLPSTPFPIPNHNAPIPPFGPSPRAVFLPALVFLQFRYAPPRLLRPTLALPWPRLLPVLPPSPRPRLHRGPAHFPLAPFPPRSCPRPLVLGPASSPILSPSFGPASSLGLAPPSAGRSPTAPGPGPTRGLCGLAARLSSCGCAGLPTCSAAHACGSRLRIASRGAVLLGGAGLRTKRLWVGGRLGH